MELTGFRKYVEMFRGILNLDFAKGFLGGGEVGSIWIIVLIVIVILVYMILKSWQDAPKIWHGV